MLIKNCYSGFTLLVDTTASGMQEVPLNLATGPLSLPVPPLLYFSEEAAAKSRAVAAGISSPFTTTSASSNKLADIDEDYDA